MPFVEDQWLLRSFFSTLTLEPTCGRDPIVSGQAARKEMCLILEKTGILLKNLPEGQSSAPTEMPNRFPSPPSRQL
jgi:hypothetical protein